MVDVVTRGEIIQQILEKHGVTTAEQFETVGYQSDCMIELYQFFLNGGEMPIGIAKARTGDPAEWIDARVRSVMGW